MHIVYYITPHGYGHAVRSAALCNKVDPAIRITIRTLISKTFFDEELFRPYNYTEAGFDCGCLQIDGVTVDIEKTADSYRALSWENRKKLLKEVSFLKQEGVDLVLSDIVPFAFEAAYEADIPSVGVGNFSWIDIYSAYEERDSLFKSIIKEIEEQYQKATYLFRLQPAMEMKGFKAETFDIPLLCGENTNKRNDLKEMLQISKNKNIALIYVGNYGLADVNWGQLEIFKDWVFLSVYDIPDAPKNFRLINKKQISYRDVAASVDLVIGKIGYGTTCECVKNSTPIIYLPRDDFTEHPVLENYLAQRDLAIKCNFEMFKNMTIEKLLDEAVILKNKQRDTILCNGDEKAANKIKELLSAIK